MTFGTPVIKVTPEEEEFYKGRLELRCAEATALVEKIFSESTGRQKEVQFNQQIFSAIKGTLIGLASQTEARLDVLIRREQSFQQRIDQLEARGIKYLGVWQRAMIYRKGDVITFDGSAWVALRDTQSRVPGNDWQLMVRCGRDGKNGA